RALVQVIQLAQCIGVVPVGDGQQADAFAIHLTARYGGLLDKGGTARDEVELPQLLCPLARVTQRLEGCEHLGFILAAVGEKEQRPLFYRFCLDPPVELLNQVPGVQRAVEPHLDLAVAAGQLLPWRVDASEDSNGPLLTKCEKSRVDV